MKKKFLKTIVPLMLCFSFIAPSGIKASAAKDTSEAQATAVSSTKSKRIVTYFPSWGVYQAGQQNIQVKDIAWDKVTHINHGFFEITNDYNIQTTDSYADYENTAICPAVKEDWNKYPATGVPPGTVFGHFGAYKAYKEKYPNVKILISVGGWTRSDKFSDVALTEANRKTLANNMVKFMQKYPFIDGMDIDWEYPTFTRAPEDQYDRGAIGRPEDKQNFTLLLKTIRETFDANNMKEKLLTVAVSAGEAKIKQTEPDKYAQYVDYIGVMTYDFAGSWDDTTGHLAGLYQNPKDTLRPKFNMNDAMKIFKDDYKVPTDKLLAGTPLYSRGWAGVEPGPNGDGLFQKATKNLTGNLGEGGQYSYYDLPKLEQTAGWKKFRDPIARTPYLYNASTKQFITYEDEESLKERVNYINDNNYGGLIVWDASGETLSNYPMHTIMYKGLINGEKFPVEKPTFKDEDVNEDSVIDLADLSMVASKYNLKKGTVGYDAKCDINKDDVIDIFDLVRVAKMMDKVIDPTDPTDPTDPEEPQYPNDTYDATKVYTGGNTVIYKGLTYKAQWWTQGEAPGTSSVWVLVK